MIRTEKSNGFDFGYPAELFVIVNSTNNYTSLWLNYMFRYLFRKHQLGIK